MFEIMNPIITMKLFSIALIFFYLHNITESVKIQKIRVPESIAYNSEVTMDCDFSIDESEKYESVIKWRFNDLPIYQWILNNSNESKPQLMNALKYTKTNLNPNISLEAYKKGKIVLKFIPGNWNLTGNYTCFMESGSKEDAKTKHMLVYKPEKYLDLTELKGSEGFKMVQCRAGGIFPQPAMSLHSNRREIKAEVKPQSKDGLYAITAEVTLPELELDEEISCILSITQTNYTKHISKVISPGIASATTARTNKWLTLITSMIIIFYMMDVEYFGVR